jgi:hypothetical protein
VSRFCGTGAHLPPRHARAHFYHIAVQNALDTGRAARVSPTGAAVRRQKKNIKKHIQGVFLLYDQPPGRQSATIEAGGNAFSWDYDALRVGTPAVLWRRLHAWFCRLQPTEHRRNARVSWVSHFLTLSLAQALAAC